MKTTKKQLNEFSTAFAAKYGIEALGGLMRQRGFRRLLENDLVEAKAEADKLVADELGRCRVFADEIRPHVKRLGAARSAKICGVSSRCIHYWVKGIASANLATKAGAILLLSRAK